MKTITRHAASLDSRGGFSNKERACQAINNISDDKFRSMFRILCNAAAHEISDLVTFVFGENKKQGKIPSPILHTYRRILILEGAANGKSFSDQELIHYGFDPQDSMLTGLNLSSIKKLCLDEVQKFRSQIIEAESSIAQEIHICPELEEQKKIGLMLCDCLEKLMCGDIDFESEIIEKVIYSPPRVGIHNEIRTHASIKKCDAEITYESEELHRRKVLHHPIFFYLIFENILSNSKRAMEGEEDAKIHVHMRSSANRVIIEFKDNGCGMDSLIVKRLNSGLRTTTKLNGQEHGLGFQYCRELAQKMNGDLYVSESELGVGTIVVLELPLA
jgi:hypothetical protein